MTPRPTQHAALPPHLLHAYRQTRYCAAGAVVRIGRRSAALDAVLARHGARYGVFVTAWNPHSRRMPNGWNQRMQLRLSVYLRRWEVLPASGNWGRWREDHLMALTPVAVVARLARRFRQNAVVVTQRGRPAALHVFHVEEPAARS